MAGRAPEPAPRRSGNPPDRAAAGSLIRDSRLVERAVTRAKEGDPEGLHLLYVRHADEVLSKVAELVDGHHTAEEVTEGVFAKLGAEISAYDPSEARFSVWIFRLARRATFEHVFTRALGSGDQ